MRPGSRSATPAEIVTRTDRPLTTTGVDPNLWQKAMSWVASDSSETPDDSSANSSPPTRATRPNGGRHHLTDRAENGVACDMAVGVVDPFEFVDVENHQRQYVGQRDRSGFHQGAPIGKARERIRQAQRLGLQLGPVEFEVRLADRARDGRREPESEEHRKRP